MTPIIYRKVIHHLTPDAPTPPRGLGDVVANLTKAVGVKPCGGCQKRQEALNRLVPFAQQPQMQPPDEPKTP